MIIVSRGNGREKEIKRKSTAKGCLITLIAFLISPKHGVLLSGDGGKRNKKCFIDSQDARDIYLDDQFGFVMYTDNGAYKLLWQDIAFIQYDKQIRPFMLIKSKDLLEIGISDQREHHEAIWQMVLRHCVGRAGVKIDPHWQAYWEAYQQE